MTDTLFGDAPAVKVLDSRRSRFMERVVATAEKNQWRVYVNDSLLLRAHGVPQAGSKGFPALTLVRGGVFLMRLILNDGAYPTNAGHAWLNELRDAGIDVGEWRPQDWHLVQECLI